MEKGTALRLAEALNRYEGDNFWEDVVETFDEVDRDASIEADDGRGQIIILNDGTRVVNYEPDDTWYVQGRDDYLIR